MLNKCFCLHSVIEAMCSSAQDSVEWRGACKSCYLIISKIITCSFVNKKKLMKPQKKEDNCCSYRTSKNCKSLQQKLLLEE